MSNVFLNGDSRDVETAILLENAVVTDIGEAVAYTDGKRVFINTPDNLFHVLPAYNDGMLKWLLWHEKMHMELRHHNRFFKYIREEMDELTEGEMMDKFHVSKDEVNIIMDILVHDSMSAMFPELVETAIANLAQMRNRNSLDYTFTKHTLEEMLNEYKAHKHDDKDKEGKTDEPKDESKEAKEAPEGEPGGTRRKAKPKDKKEDKEGESKESDESEGKSPEGERREEHSKGSDIKDGVPEPEHEKTDWSKLKDIDTREFIKEYEGDRYVEQIQKLKRKKFRLGQITQTLNGLATTSRQRSYAMPSTIRVGESVLMKGRTPGKTRLYLCFDASGSMGDELETFKEIIQKSVPQALDVPCEWFTYSYKKGKFKDILDVYATSGFDDDGDRLIELCWKAEQEGYSPIGVTDGGGSISWSKDKLKQLKRTVLVGQNGNWLKKAQMINPRVQILDISE